MNHKLIVFKLLVIIFISETYSFVTYSGAGQLRLQPTYAVDGTVISLAAGSLAGVVGIGTAYPLDALKTKAQTYGTRQVNGQGKLPTSGLGTNIRSPSMFEMARIVLNEEGIKGFYGGVYGVMLGQAFVKAVLFSSNAFALQQLTSLSNTDIQAATFVQLCLAAAFSGLVSSFVLNPIERVKILMQADQSGTYASEVDCIGKVLAQDGLSGLLLRGLDGMLAREIPGATVYFVAYSLLVHSALASYVGPAAPFLCGGMAGVLAWIPIYPSDVIKTNMQNTQGSDSKSAVGAGAGDASLAPNANYLQTALFLLNRFGVGVFFDGIQPKLYRAAVNHSVTFYVYDLIMRTASASASGAL